MWLTARRLVMALAAILTFGLAEPAHACSCMRQTSAAEHLESNVVAFRGRAVRTVTREAGASGIRRQVTEFEVIETLKGRPVAVRRIGHPENVCCICGVSFEPGREYFVLAYEHDGRLSTGSCNRPQFPIAEYRDALAAE